MVLSWDVELRPLALHLFRSKTVTRVLSAMRPSFEPQVASMVVLKKRRRGRERERDRARNVGGRG